MDDSCIPEDELDLMAGSSRMLGDETQRRKTSDPMREVVKRSCQKAQ
jgi:hypothetical protein